jgi:multidrug efflux pump subunit AcrA (membrane-fusion protein)
MQEKIQQLTQKAVANKKISIGLLVGVIVLVGGLVSFNVPTKDSLAIASAAQAGKEISGVEVAVAGATSTTDISSGGNSWPGELISLGSVPVQPSREGTISSWNVHIGQKVSAGEVLGVLSQPPAMPDTVAMVAEKAGDAAMSRANVEAKRAYVSERIKQLTALRSNTEQSLSTSQDLLGSNGSAGLPMIAAKKEVIRSILRSTFAKTYPIFSGNATLPLKWSSISLIDPIGAQNSGLRNQFPSVIFAVKSDLDTPEKSPVVSGLAYYDLMIKLADASLPDGSMLTDTMLADVKTMLHADQQEFIMAVDEEKKTELMAVDTNKASFEQLKDIDNEIATLTQDLAMAEGDVSAKDAAYKAVRSGVLGGSAIIAPKSGTVSSISKKVGEFVGPGMPVAVVTGDNGNDEIVRFRIPSNIRKPEIGTIFYVTRPGFPESMPKVKLIGVGNSLDDTGSVMADALFLEPIDWPVGISLRVVAGIDTETLEIPLSSLWWDASGGANIWAVSKGGRIYAKKVSLGRTLGERIEVYSGLSRGEEYVVKPVPGISEDMLLDDIKAPDVGQKGESSYDAAMRAMGM